MLLEGEEPWLIWENAGAIGMAPKVPFIDLDHGFKIIQFLIVY